MKKKEPEIIRDSVEYSLRKHNAYSHGLMEDILTCFIDGLAHLVARHEVDEVQRRVTQRPALRRKKNK